MVVSECQLDPIMDSQISQKPYLFSVPSQIPNPSSDGKEFQWIFYDQNDSAVAGVCVRVFPKDTGDCVAALSRKDQSILLVGSTLNVTTFAILFPVYGKYLR